MEIAMATHFYQIRKTSSAC